MTFLSNAFYLIMAGFVSLTTVIFGFFTVIVLATIVGFMRGKNWTLRERVVSLSLLGFTALWGGWLTWYSAGWASWLAHLVK